MPMARAKGQTDISDCFISIKKLDIDKSAVLKHLGYKFVGESIGTTKEKVYYNQVSDNKTIPAGLKLWTS